MQFTNHPLTHAMTKTFRTLKTEECAEVAEEILDHVERKWESAKKLSRHGFYAEALATKVNALEELAKVFVLAIDSHGLHLRRLKNLKVLERNHSQRHAVILMAAMFDVLGESIRAAGPWMEANQQRMSLLFLTPGRIEAEVIPLIEDHYKKVMRPSLKNAVQWASMLSAIRTDSLYTDFRGELVTPVAIGRKVYSERSKRLDRVYTSFRQFCISVLNSSYEDPDFKPLIMLFDVPQCAEKLDESLGKLIRGEDIFKKALEALGSDSD